MKTSWRIFCLTMVAAAIASSAAAADFTLNIPNRVGFDIALVRIRLEAYTPGGTPTLTIGGTSVSASGLPVILPDGDEVSFATGATTAVIVYNPKSLFPVNLCTGGGAKSVTITYNNFTFTNHRINSYTVPTDLYGCTIASRRISMTVASLTGAGTNIGRNALNVILVLDKSGSMSSPPPAPSGSDLSASKWQSLKAAVNSFIDQWDLEAGAPANDRLGVVFFDELVFTKNVGPTFFRRRDAADADPAKKGILAVKGVFDLAPATSPGGWTSIGGGVKLAKTSNTAESDAVFILLTDGEQNRPPDVVLLPKVGDTYPAMTIDTIADDLPSWGIPIQTIAFGTPAETETTLLDQMAQQTMGNPLRTTKDLGVGVAFGSQLVNILKGDTVSKALTEESALSTTPGPLRTISVDASVRRIIFNVQWPSGSTPNALDLQVFPPGGSPITDASTGIDTIRRDSPFSTSQAVDVPDDGPAGDWKVRVIRRPVPEVGITLVQTKPVPYALNAIVQETRLDYSILFDETKQRTGDTLTVRAEMAWDHLPLSGLPSGAIRVRIKRPPEAIGTILHDTLVPPDVLTPGGGADVRSPYRNKLHHLIENNDLLARVLPQPVDTIELHDDGDGVYTGTFSDTSRPGQYDFDVTLDWNDPRTGAIRRIENLSRTVTIHPDADSSEVLLTFDDEIWTLTVTPRDRFGNYFGPGGADFINVIVQPPATVSGPVDINQTGTYVYTIGNVPPGSTPDVKVVVDGVTISDGAAGGRWRAFIDFGTNFPDGSGLDGEWSINGGIERMFSNNWSVEGIVGYHTFDATLADVEVWQLSANAKYFFGTSPFRPFINGGAGLYDFDPGQPEFGVNAGLGLLWELNAKWGIEGVFNYHTTDSLDWSTAQVGVRWHF